MSYSKPSATSIWNIASVASGVAVIEREPRARDRARPTEAIELVGRAASDAAQATTASRTSGSQSVGVANAMDDAFPRLQRLIRLDACSREVDVDDPRHPLPARPIATKDDSQMDGPAAVSPKMPRSLLGRGRATGSGTWQVARWRIHDITGPT